MFRVVHVRWDDCPLCGERRGHYTNEYQDGDRVRHQEWCAHQCPEPEPEPDDVQMVFDFTA